MGIKGWTRECDDDDVGTETPQRQVNDPTKEAARVNIQGKERGKEQLDERKRDPVACAHLPGISCHPGGNAALISMALSTMGTGTGRTAFFFPVGEDDVVKKEGDLPPFRSPKICQRCEEKEATGKDPTAVAKMQQLREFGGGEASPIRDELNCKK
jgi:hypothetical protein